MVVEVDIGNPALGPKLAVKLVENAIDRNLVGIYRRIEETRGHAVDAAGKKAEKEANEKVIDKGMLLIGIPGAVEPRP